MGDDGGREEEEMGDDMAGVVVGDEVGEAGGAKRDAMRSKIEFRWQVV